MIKYLLLLLILSGCSLEYQVGKHPERARELLGVPDSIIITHEKIVNVETSSPDSGWLYAYFACDSLNNVLLQTIQGGNSIGIKTEYIYKDRILKYYFKTDSVKLAKSIIEKYGKEKIVTVEVDKRSTLDKLAKVEQMRNLYLKIAIGLAAIIIILAVLKYFRLI